jgi:DNA-binding transcriptional ArsR family regulator
MCAPRSTVERWLRELEHAGIVERIRTGRASVYRLAVEPEAAPPAIERTPETAGSRSLKNEGSDPSEVVDQDPPSEEGRSLKTEVSDPSGLRYPSSGIPFTDGVEFQESTTRVEAREGASAACLAWTRALTERGRLFQPDPSLDAGRFRAVAALADAMRGERGLDDTLLDLARRHIAGRRTGTTPAYWLEWLQREASAGRTAHGVSDAASFVQSEIPTTPTKLRSA